MSKDVKYINELIARIGSDSKEVIVTVQVEPYATPKNCFPNVEEKVKRDGGSIVYGWSVLLGQFLVEAERHAIWKSPQNELIDITPSTSGMETTLFIPYDLVYTGQFIDNVRVNATDNKVVDDWTIVASLRTKIFNAIRSKNGVSIRTPDPIMSLHHRYDNLNNLYFSYLNAGGTEETNCFCQSGKIYKKCHGTMTINDCKRDSERIDYLKRKKKI